MPYTEPGGLGPRVLFSMAQAFLYKVVTVPEKPTIVSHASLSPEEGV